MAFFAHLEKFKPFILAGSYQQYRDYCREVGINPHTGAIYVSSFKRLLGYRNRLVIKVGTWWRRDDLWEIEERLRSQECFTL